MIDNKTAQTNDISKRIFNVIQDTAEFLLVLVRMILCLLQNGIEKLLPKKLKDVSGDIVLITGTGHGIGRELALHYVAWGSTVICVDIVEKNNEETVEKAKRLCKGSVHSYICDVTDREAVLKLAERVKSEVGPVTILVNNAGIMPTHTLDMHTPEEIYRVFNVNVFAQFWTLEAFLPHMKQQNRGHVVCMSSAAGMVGLANLVPYCATKFAVRGLMEALREEVRESPYRDLIKFTTIYPYMTNTGLCKHPRVKFPSILGLLDPKFVARCIVEAQRSEAYETTIPSILMYINNWCRLLPVTCASIMKDFIDSGVESDL